MCVPRSRAERGGSRGSARRDRSGAAGEDRGSAGGCGCHPAPGCLNDSGRGGCESCFQTDDDQTHEREVDWCYQRKDFRVNFAAASAAQRYVKRKSIKVIA